LEEASSFLCDHPGAKVLAGGQSLIPILKLNLAEVEYLVDLKRIPGLSDISIVGDRLSEGKDALQVGALVTHSELEQSEKVKEHVPLLSETSSGIGHPLVRNRGTLGGSLSHCDPAADLCAAALALDAKITLAGKGSSRRTLRADQFFLGPLTTALEKGEILEKVGFPLRGEDAGHSVRKFTLGHGDFPILVVCVLVEKRRGALGKVAISLGGVSGRAIRMKDAEEYLEGRRGVTQEDFGRAAQLVVESCDPAPDLEVSREYKLRMVEVLTRRALAEAAKRAGGER